MYIYMFTVYYAYKVPLKQTFISGPSVMKEYLLSSSYPYLAYLFFFGASFFPFVVVLGRK
jgi:hypothetical protein